MSRLHTLNARIATISGVTILVTVVLLVVASSLLSGRFATQAAEATDALVEANLDELMVGVQDLVQAQSDAVQRSVDANLEVARFVAERDGGFGFDPDRPVTWEARNQFSGEVTTVTLPAMTVGGTWFGQDSSFDARQPLVDQVQDLVDGTVTVFQRIEGSGDMLRVATNVRTLDDTRAVSTTIPEFNPDGSPNPVVGAVLAGETFRGNAFVVTSWQATAYEPIVQDGEVVGMLFVGVPQESVPSLRSGIVDTSFGDNGEVLVVGASGAGRGEIRIADDHEAGAQLLEQLPEDTAGAYDALIDEAIAAEGSVVRATIDLVDVDGGSAATALRAVHFAPWDWVIIASAPVSDFEAAAVALDAGRTQMLLALIAVGALAAVVLGFGGSWLGARRIGAILRTNAAAVTASGEELSRLARELDDAAALTATQATGASSGAEQVGSNVGSVATAIEELEASVREIAQHASDASAVASTAVDSARRTNETVSRLGDASAEIGEVVGLITTIAEQTNLLALNATIEAARAGEAGRGFAVVAGEVKGLATETQQATERIGERIAAIQTQTGEAVTAIESIVVVIEQIADLQTTIASAVEEQSATSQEISRSVNEAALGAGSIADNVGELARVAHRSSEVAQITGVASAELLERAAELRALVEGAGSTTSAAPALPAAPRATPDTEQPEDRTLVGV
ncbi:MAG: Cache 3/Cache 2 fusion domain-containing protein [Nitriliruptoraceae bacterium]|nr:Cache 3/Cache 2 fusion domain-containing protein [Nitriliruptoraceae bacterium]